MGSLTAACNSLSRLCSSAECPSFNPGIDAAAMAVGRWRLVFAVADYFRAQGVALPEPPFVDVVNLDFGIADANAKYHVPLLVSPWSYSTYRGS